MDALCKIRDICRAVYEFEMKFQATYGIGLNEGMVLCSISNLGQCSSGQLAELLGLSSSNSSKVIISVENKGLIERIVGKADKRQMYFKLTSQGKKLLEEVKCNSEYLIEALAKIREV